MKKQISIGYLMLLMAWVATAIAVWQKASSNQWYRDRLVGLREVARELVVDDPTQIHAVIDNPDWLREEKWKIYLPPGQQYRLNLLTRGLPYDEKVAVASYPQKSIVLSPGEHTVECHGTILDKGSDEHRIEVFVDDELVMAIDEGADWFGSGASYCSGGPQSPHLFQSKPFPVDGKVVLYFRRHLELGTTPQQIAYILYNGVLLWIEDENCRPQVPIE